MKFGPKDPEKKAEMVRVFSESEDYGAMVQASIMYVFDQRFDRDDLWSAMKEVRLQKGWAE